MIYPLPVVFVGRNERTMPQIRRELHDLSVEVKAEFRSCTELLNRREHFRAEPHLFIYHLENDEGLNDLRRLNSVFIGRPVLALLEKGRNVDALIAAMRAGASQVVPLPLDAEEFHSELKCSAVQYGRGAVPARLIAISGVTGGCGATTLASNLAYELAHTHDRRVILSEMTLQMGMLVTHLDVKPQYTLRDLLTYDAQIDAEVVQKSLTRFSDTLSILAGPDRPIVPAPDLITKLATVIDSFCCLADFVVLDVPCTFDDSYFDILSGADHVILLGEQRIPSIRNSQMVLDALGHKKNLNLQMVLNRYDPDMPGFTTKDLCKLLNLSKIMTITNDPLRVTAALNQGRPLRLVSPHTPVLKDIDQLIQSTLEISTPQAAPAAHGNLFRSLINAFGMS